MLETHTDITVSSLSVPRSCQASSLGLAQTGNEENKLSLIAHGKDTLW